MALRRRQRSTLTIAKQQGYQLAFTLNDGLGNVKDLDNIPRLLIAGNPSLKAFASAVTQIQEADPVRVMHVDLDYVYDPNPVQQAKNIDKLVQRVYDMKISHVFLQAFSDPQGDGTVKSLYFPNRWLPMRADLFNFVSWQLQTRGNVKVYAWMPVLAFDLAQICRAFSAGIRKPGRRYLPASRTSVCRPGIPGFASRSPTSTKIWPDTPASAGFCFTTTPC